MVVCRENKAAEERPSGQAGRPLGPLAKLAFSWMSV